MTSWFLSWRCCQIFLGSLIMFRHWLKSQIIITFGFGVTKSFVYMRYTLREKWPCSELFWPVFSLIRAEYGVSISPYSVQMRENADQNNSEYGHILRSDNQKPDFLIEIHWRNFFCRSKVSYLQYFFERENYSKFSGVVCTDMSFFLSYPSLYTRRYTHTENEDYYLMPY